MPTATSMMNVGHATPPKDGKRVTRYLGNGIRRSSSVIPRKGPVGIRAVATMARWRMTGRGNHLALELPPSN